MITSTIPAVANQPVKTIAEKIWENSGKEGPNVPDNKPVTFGGARSVESARNMLEIVQKAVQAREDGLALNQKTLADYPQKLEDMRAGGATQAEIAFEEMLFAKTRESVDRAQANLSADRAYAQAKIDLYTNLVNTLTEREPTAA